MKGKEKKCVLSQVGWVRCPQLRGILWLSDEVPEVCMCTVYIYFKRHVIQAHDKYTAADLRSIS